MPCVFVAIGKKRSEVMRIRSILSNFNSLDYTCIVFTSSDTYASLQYLAPYAGAAVGE
jgi:F-type H+-transporting ATPase subunit alpha